MPGQKLRLEILFDAPEGTFSEPERRRILREVA
jgi:hypothetical protein